VRVEAEAVVRELPAVVGRLRKVIVEVCGR